MSIRLSFPDNIKTIQVVFNMFSTCSLSCLEALSSYSVNYYIAYSLKCLEHILCTIITVYFTTQDV